MIGSFWNLCRACPSMPVDKLHSEYRSTYRWHEYTGPRQDVIRRPPQPNVAAPSAEKSDERNRLTRTIDEESYNEVPKLEPALPRRKKHPELAYRTHEFMTCDGDGSINGPSAAVLADRARSEERGGSHWRPSRRSKSEGPARANVSIANGMRRRRDSDPDLENTGRDTGLFKKAISKISTEYRLQFAWPPGHASRADERDNSLPRKSLSMGAIKPAANAMVHKKRTDQENRDASELEPLVNDNTIHEDRREEKYEFVRSEGRFARTKRADDVATVDATSKLLAGHSASDAWYKEVVELRKKAGEYKHRGWGTELAPDRIAELYNKQIELWDQVSRRSSLSALSLASTSHRSYTKEEKEQENNKKSSPTKALRNAENSARMMKDMIRHHLERTTGGTEFDGLILSPTREKLEPTIPRKDDDSRSSQKNSPQKSSPQKNSPQKLALQKRNSQKAKNALRTTRSQSVGPTEVSAEKRSPKRQSRSATVKAQKTPSSTTASTTTNSAPTVQKRPRPSSLNTTASSRYKCSTVPHKTGDERLAKAKTKSLNQNAQNRELSAARKGADSSAEKGPVPAVAEPEPIDMEPVIKSPPEPTRVKSPEQILMRSPDPVNWTVPLDTGKTFTVTQNVREGDPITRPHSEVKAWTPPDVPPPAAQSAPPELAEQAKVQGSKTIEFCDESSPSTSKSNVATISAESTIINGGESQDENIPNFSNLETGSRPVAGTKLRCLDDPLLEDTFPISVKTPAAQSTEKNPTAYRVLEAPSVVSPTASSRSIATEVLEKARNRFDMFWGKNSKDDNV